MANESTVYWASPFEQPALPDTAKNMVTNNLVKTRFVMDKILDNINGGDKVGVKVHVGEANNTRYLRPDYVREVVKSIKSKGGIPTLIETHGRGNNISDIEMNDEYHVCVGHRKKTEDHLKIAHLHGYTESITGAPLEFIDGEKGIDRKIVKIDGIHFKEVSVAKGLFDFDKLVVISHFKGHPFAGVGGALKQLGLGCVTKHNKHLAHLDKKLVVNSRKCNPSECNQECLASCLVDAIKMEGESAHIDDLSCYGCFKCSQKCPIKGAIKGPGLNSVKTFVERFIDNTTAVLTFGPEKIRYINFALEIPLMCDCASNPSMPVIPDLGIYGSSDPVAIDRACLDAEIDAPGLPFINKEGEWTTPLEPGVEKFKVMLPYLDPLWQFEAAVRNKIGNTSYNLIKI